jgi:divalent metal cation (Fe/Co/Zn/Cd) transporter
VEALVSLSTAWIARSPALLAFGGDSAVELFSAFVVLWAFRADAAQRDAQERASRVTGGLLFVLAAYVTTVSVLSLMGHGEPKPTYLGVAVLIAAAVFMPWLAKEKRKLSAATGSAALRADAAESALCAYLSLIALVGLGVNAIWHVSAAHPIGFGSCAGHRVGRPGRNSRKGLWLLTHVPPLDTSALSESHTHSLNRTECEFMDL